MILLIYETLTFLKAMKTNGILNANIVHDVCLISVSKTLITMCIYSYILTCILISLVFDSTSNLFLCQINIYVSA